MRDKEKRILRHGSNPMVGKASKNRADRIEGGFATPIRFLTLPGAKDFHVAITSLGIDDNPLCLFGPGGRMRTEEWRWTVWSKWGGVSPSLANGLWQRLKSIILTHLPAIVMIGG